MTNDNASPRTIVIPTIGFVFTTSTMPLTKRNASREANKLASKEGDWNLAAVGATTETRTRTRGNGKGRPNLDLARKNKAIICDISSDSESEVEEEGGGAKAIPVPDEEIVPPKTRKRPPHTRVIVEVNNLEAAFEKFKCPSCGEATVELKLWTVCIATSLSFVCKRKACVFAFQPMKAAPTTLHAAQNDNYERTTDYAVNVLYVLGFMSMGDAHTEAGRLLGWAIRLTYNNGELLVPYYRTENWPRYPETV
jgi:predicted RNA-binding Zn-ribbon protein involved in translation (DUF1610 family)